MSRLNRYKFLFLFVFFCHLVSAQERQTFEDASWQQRDSMISTLYQGGAMQVVNVMIEDAYNAEKAKSVSSEAFAVFSLWQGIKNLTEQNYTEAENYLAESIATFEDLPDNQSGKYLDALLNMSDLQAQLENPTQQLSFIDKALAKIEDNVEDYKSLYHSTLLQSIDVSINNGLYDRAQEYGRKALKFAQETFSNQSDEYFQSLVAVGKIYLAQGETRRAANLIFQAYELAKTYLPANDINRVYYGTNAISMLKSLGRYNSAETAYEEINEFFENNGDYKSENIYPAVLDDMGSFYEEIGELDKAYDYYEKANVLFALRLERTDPLYIKSQLNVGNILRRQKKYTEAEGYYRDALQHSINLYGEKNWSEATLRDNLGSIYYELGDYERSLAEREKVREIAEFVWGPNHQEFAYALLNLGKTYAKAGRIDDARVNLETAFSKLTKLFGDKHYRVFESAKELAVFYEDVDPKAALEKYIIAGNFITNYMQQTLPLLAASDRLQFLDDFNKVISRFTHYTLAHQSEIPATVSSLQNLLINFKSVKQIPDLSSISGYLINPSTELRRAYGDWQALRQKMINAQSLTIAEQKEADLEVEKLDEQISMVQKKILPVFNSSTYRHTANAEIGQIKSRIGANDAIIDFHEINIYNKEDDTYENNDTYLVFITPGRSANTKLITIQLNKNIIQTGQLNSQTNYYDQIWQPIEKEILNSERLFICPDNFLNKVCFSALPTSGDKLLVEDHDITMINDLNNLSASDIQVSSDHVLILGSPDYYDNGNSDRDNIPSLMLKINPVDLGSSDLRENNQINQSSSSLAELNTLSSVFTKKKKTVELKNSKQASKLALHQELKDKSWPIIQLSVPLFSLPESDSLNNKDQPGALRCGLALSGAQTAWKNDSLPQNILDDGLLTAEEIYTLNLSTTRLAVLPSMSATVSTDGNSFYSIKKSLLDSGVKRIIYTLWPIPESDRTAFLQLFYKNLVKSGSVDQSFSKTQIKFRKKTDPRIWAGFVLTS